MGDQAATQRPTVYLRVDSSIRRIIGIPPSCGSVLSAHLYLVSRLFSDRHAPDLGEGALEAVLNRKKDSKPEERTLW